MLKQRDASPPTQSLRVDKENNLIYGVKICGLTTRDGSRRYPIETLRRASNLYEGAPVNLSHLKDGERHRDFEDRIGWLKNIEVREDGTYGDFHYNPHHPYANALLYFAEKNPRAIGLSHDIDQDSDMDFDGHQVVTRINYVYGVDLVADPNTTEGLREAMDMSKKPEGSKPTEDMNLDDMDGGNVQPEEQLLDGSQ